MLYFFLSQYLETSHPIFSLFFCLSTCKVVVITSLPSLQATLMPAISSSSSCLMYVLPCKQFSNWFLRNPKNAH